MNAVKKTGRAYVDRQVLSALLVGGSGSSFFDRAVADALARIYGAEAPPTSGAGLGIAIFALFYGSAWYWSRPIERFLTTGDESLRAIAQRRHNAMYRFLIGLWAVGWLIDVVWNWAHKPVAPWGWMLVQTTVGHYYAAYFTILFLEPLLIAKVSNRLYTEDEIFRRKAGPGWTVHMKLALLVVNLILIPILLLEALRRTGASPNTALGLMATTFVFAAGYLEVLYRGIAAPLTGLIDKMRRVAAGDYTAKTIVLDDDEIGELKAYFNDMVDGLAERERLKDTFGRYVSVEVAKRLLETGAVSLGGESIEATVLFSDIRDFTPMSESMPPQDLVRFLNSYFSAITPPISAHHGMINKFIGDAVMAVFAPQFGSPNHVDDTVRAALGMRAALAEFNAREGRAIRFGVGLHTGGLVAGNIGTEKRLEYTVIGDTVNVASRIESQNKELESVILVSEDVWNKMSPGLKSTLRGELRDGVKLKGKERPVALYSL